MSENELLWRQVHCRDKNINFLRLPSSKRKYIIIIDICKSGQLWSQDGNPLLKCVGSMIILICVTLWSWQVLRCKIFVDFISVICFIPWQNQPSQLTHCHSSTPRSYFQQQLIIFTYILHFSRIMQHTGLGKPQPRPLLDCLMCLCLMLGRPWLFVCGCFLHHVSLELMSIVNHWILIVFRKWQ